MSQELQIKAFISDIEPKLDRNANSFYKLTLLGCSDYFYAFSYNLKTETLTILKETPDNLINRQVLITYQELANKNNEGTFKKVKEGIKPSTLKKSKSLNDLPTSTKSPPLKSSHSTTDIPLIEPTELEDKISVLELKLETKDRELEDKDQTIKDFRKAFQKADQEIERLKKELDDSLQARYESVKQFGLIYAKLQSISKELDDTVDEASDELVNQDQIITKLRTQKQQAQARIQELEKDLQLQASKYPLPTNSPNLDYLKMVLCLGTFILTI